MKLESLSQITDLCDFLENNRLIAHYCGFDATKKLPSYWTYNRFLKNFDNTILKKIMESQVLKLAELRIIDSSFIGLDSTPVSANTSHNNPKSFLWNKFRKDNHPKSDMDCGLGIRTASNSHNKNKFEFYWGYKNHVLCDCITGLPIYETTTAAGVSDSTVTLDILEKTNKFLPLNECSFLADKAYDIKNIYNTIRKEYHGDCFIPLNPRNTKNLKLLPTGHPICKAGLAMHKDGKVFDNNRVRQKFCCPYKLSKYSSDCPVNHDKFHNGKKSKGCVKYITIPDDYRLSIDRNAKNFIKTYSLRTECERYNSRFKATGQEKLSVRNLKSAANLNTFAHISLLSVAVAAVLSNSSVSYRCIKSVKRIA